MAWTLGWYTRGRTFGGATLETPLVEVPLLGLGGGAVGAVSLRTA